MKIKKDSHQGVEGWTVFIPDAQAPLLAELWHLIWRHMKFPPADAGRIYEINPKER